MPRPPITFPIPTTLQQIAAEIERIAWESAHPHIPWDITEEEADRGTVVNGKWQMAPEDVARRAGVGRAA